MATFGGGFAFDAAFPAGGADTTAAVSTRLVAGPSAADASATVEVAISDPAWLAKPGRAFPVKVDPSFWQNTSSGQGRETYVTNGPYVNSSFGTSTAVVSGADPNYYVSRTLIYFNLGSLPAANKVVTSAAGTSPSEPAGAQRRFSALLRGSSGRREGRRAPSNGRSFRRSSPMSPSRPPSGRSVPSRRQAPPARWRRG